MSSSNDALASGSSRIVCVGYTRFIYAYTMCEWYSLYMWNMTNSIEMCDDKTYKILANAPRQAFISSSKHIWGFVKNPIIVFGWSERAWTWQKRKRTQSVQGRGRGRTGKKLTHIGHSVYKIFSRERTHLWFSIQSGWEISSHNIRRKKLLLDGRFGSCVPHEIDSAWLDNERAREQSYLHTHTNTLTQPSTLILDLIR